MKNNTFIIRLLLSLFILFFSLSAIAQKTKEELLKDKQRIENDIKYTNQLLQKTQKEQSANLNQLQLISKQIVQREDLILTISSELSLIDDEIIRLESEIEALKDYIEVLKKEYAEMIYYAYLNKDSYTRLMFLFSAADFNQAFLRLKYLELFSEYVVKQEETIRFHQLALSERLSRMQAIKDEKLGLLRSKQTERQKLDKEKNDKRETISKLKQDEQKLRAKIRENQQAAAKIQKTIEAIIAKEAGGAVTTNASGIATLTPKEKALSASFESNRGKLPWPSETGVISSTYGEHPHPALANVKIKNNGIDIATTSGANVRAVFEGVVKAVISLPNGTSAVIVRHGEYLSVYSNLSSVYVSVGQELKTKDNIGSLISDGGSSTLHFEVWKGKATQNPAYWLAK
jgi:septal ring factor EnvC (AmiA/AmiB activator)